MECPRPILARHCLRSSRRTFRTGEVGRGVENMEGRTCDLKGDAVVLFPCPSRLRTVVHRAAVDGLLTATAVWQWWTKRVFRWRGSWWTRLRLLEWTASWTPDLSECVCVYVCRSWKFEPGRRGAGETKSKKTCVLSGHAEGVVLQWILASGLVGFEVVVMHLQSKITYLFLLCSPKKIRI